MAIETPARTTTAVDPDRLATFLEARRRGTDWLLARQEQILRFLVGRDVAVDLVDASIVDDPEIAIEDFEVWGDDWPYVVWMLVDAWFTDESVARYQVPVGLRPLEQTERFLGRGERPIEIPAFGCLQVESEHQLVFGTPRGLVEERDAFREVIQRSAIGGGRLRLSAGGEIQSCNGEPFDGGVDQVRADVQMIDDCEDPIVWSVGVELGKQQTAHIQMDRLFLRLRLRRG